MIQGVKLPDKTIAAIRAAKWAGLSLFDIAIDFDVSKKTVQNYADGIPVRAKAGRRASCDHARLRTLLEAGVPQDAIAARLGITPKHVRRLCLRWYGRRPSEMRHAA